jgi:hypothetical protein
MKKEQQQPQWETGAFGSALWVSNKVVHTAVAMTQEAESFDKI